MSTAPKVKLTAAEYLEIERQAEFKSELYDGEMYAMAGASRFHNRVSENLSIEIGNRLKYGSCQSMSKDQRVSVVDWESYSYPDLVILCGAGEYDPLDQDTLLNPTVIVEVLSPSTALFDRTTKFRRYKEITSLKEYVLVAQDEPFIERFTRQPDGNWSLTLSEGLDAELAFASIPVRVPMKDVYYGMVFDRDSPK